MEAVTREDDCMGNFNGRIPKLTLEIVVDTVFEALVVVEGWAGVGKSV